MSDLWIAGFYNKLGALKSKFLATDISGEGSLVRFTVVAKLVENSIYKKCQPFKVIEFANGFWAEEANEETLKKLNDDFFEEID